MYEMIQTCDNCKGVWKVPSKYDHCPICRVFCFVHKTRTQAVYHIYDCLSKTKEADG